MVFCFISLICSLLLTVVTSFFHSRATSAYFSSIPSVSTRSALPNTNCLNGSAWGDTVYAASSVCYAPPSAKPSLCSGSVRCFNNRINSPHMARSSPQASQACRSVFPLPLMPSHPFCLSWDPSIVSEHSLNVLPEIEYSLWKKKKKKNPLVRKVLGAEVFSLFCNSSVSCL